MHGVGVTCRILAACERQEGVYETETERCTRRTDRVMQIWATSWRSTEWLGDAQAAHNCRDYTAVA